MSHNNQDNHENLNAFIDGQLATDERMQVFDALKRDESLSATLCELQRNDELIALTYGNIPSSKYDPYVSATRFSQRKKQMLAASILFILSTIIGWQFHAQFSMEPKTNIKDIAQVNFGTLDNNKVLIHISTMDAKRIEMALNKAESLLSTKKHIQLEIVANAEGLGLLRNNSPYADRIQKISQQHKNISFKACGIAMKTAKLKEGNEIKLLPEAEKVPAALDQILQRLKLGWLYIKA